MPQAIVFLTHRLNRSVRSQFERLRSEAQPYATAFLCYHATKLALAPDGAFRADIVIRPGDGARLLPLRADAMRQRAKRKYNGGFPDLALMPAMKHPDLAGFDPIWMVEYDADFAGNWRAFFARVEGTAADLISAHVRFRARDPRWSHWSWFAPPPEIPESEQLTAFNPVARYSRRFIATYFEAIASGRWAGHTEALYPTIARAAGLTIVDLGGEGPFVPAGWEGTNYTGRRPLDRSGTFRYRPDVVSAYFHQDPAGFPLPGKLYHPVKVPGLFDTRTRSRRARHWLRGRFHRWRYGPKS